jgi:TPR repeat protein
MTGSTSPCKAEPGLRPSCPPPAHKPRLASLAAIPGVYWGGSINRPRPRIDDGTWSPDDCTWSSREEKLPPTPPPSLLARLRAVPPDRQLRNFLTDLSSGVHAHGHSEASDSAAYAAGLPLEPDAAGHVPQAHVQALIQEFQRRQRRASLVVAGCVAASVLLTAAGIVALMSMERPKASDPEPGATKSSAVLHGQHASAAQPRLILASIIPSSPSEVAPADPAPAPSAETMHLARPQLIQMKANVPFALAPLLSLRQARYLLIRGLPNQAMLSAGQRNPSGAWLVKEKDMAGLSLTMSGTAGGDYPVEIYALGATSTPQARQRLLLRVAEGPTPTMSFETSSPDALFDMALTNAKPGGSPAAPGASPQMADAMRLLVDGDVAGARLLFEQLADQGESEAAYELARTFDPEALTELGVKDVQADRKLAVTWYERASETGNAKAAERLKILASLAD